MDTKDPHLTKTLKDSSMSHSDNLLDNDSTHLNTDSNVKGNETVDADTINSEHVNDGDNPARQPDRRDQQGNAFDEGVNESSSQVENIASAKINDKNKYSSIKNAQTNALSTENTQVDK